MAGKLFRIPYKKTQNFKHGAKTVISICTRVRKLCCFVIIFGAVHRVEFFFFANLQFFA